VSDPTNFGNKPGDGPLRVGGVSVSDPNGKPDLPSTKSKAAERQESALSLARDCFGGNETIKGKAQTYLPKAPGEDYQNYADRLGRSVFFNAFKQTVEGLTGLVMRRDPVLGDDVPQPLKDDWENIDNAGTHGAVFLRELLQESLTAGHAAILVDFPKTGGNQSAAEEMPGATALPIRPYWIPIKKDNILSWRTMVENGVTVLQQIVIRETTMVPEGSFGEKEQERYRVLYKEGGIVGFRLLEIANDKKTVIEVDQGTYPTQDEIPVAEIVGSDRKSMFESAPPLLDLGHLNIAHYQVDSDYKNSIHKTCVPIFVQIGAPPSLDGTAESVIIGPNAGLSLPQGGDAKYVSHDGAALDKVEKAITKIEGQMATLGLSMLAPDIRAAETAEAKRIDKSASDSKLSTHARGLQDGAERANGFSAKYRRLPGGGSITVNRDFEDLAMPAETINALSGMVEKAQLSLETMWQMLQDGNILPDTFKAEEEKGAIAADEEIRRAMEPEVDPLTGKPKLDKAA
jgi:hypothetical protein